MKELVPSLALVKESKMPKKSKIKLPTKDIISGLQSTLDKKIDAKKASEFMTYLKDKYAQGHA